MTLTNPRLALGVGLSFVLLLASPTSASAADILPRVAVASAVRADFAAIMRQAGLPEDLVRIGRIDYVTQAPDAVEISCAAGPGGPLTLDVRARPAEWAAAAYHALHKLGFLFPHPRIQVNPERARLGGHCGTRVEWQPRFAIRGSHLHTMHPSEWVKGFLQGDTAIATDTIRWHARNFQNVVQYMPLITVGIDKQYGRALKPVTTLAHDLGILVGIDVSFELRQQHSYRLVARPQEDPYNQMYREWARLGLYIDFDFATLELGGTEFWGSDSGTTLAWIEYSRKLLAREGKRIYLKAHVSMPKDNPQDNFNFIAQKCHPDVGVLPHTVMFYGFGDAHTPVYGRTDLKDVWEMLRTEVTRRPMWFYPETSYFIAMDIDVPILLTDYLKVRSDDMDRVEAAGVTGHLNFTTGQELGYWLMDWTTALLTSRDHAGDPMAGLRLLGEDPDVWQRILDFQTKHIKQGGLISMISTSTYLDEMPPPIKQEVHSRNTLSELSKRPALIAEEIARLEAAMAELPPTAGIRNPELRQLIEVTQLRITHAYFIRRALARGEADEAGRAAELQSAVWVRQSAQALMDEVVRDHDRYPTAHLYEKREDMTSYAWGYGFPAATMNYWLRDEEVARRWKFSPFFMSIYDMFSILD